MDRMVESESIAGRFDMVRRESHMSFNASMLDDEKSEESKIERKTKVSAIRVSDLSIGPGQPCFVIAEAGVNHCGSIEMAMELVDAALESGADAVKFQTWVTEKLVAPSACSASYQRRNTGKDQNQFEMLKDLELDFASFRKLKEYSDKRGIMFLSTPDEECSADFLEELGVPLFKIGSAEVTNLRFLKHIALKQKPIILSTGMSTLAEVEDAVREIEHTGNRQIILLHCVSSYPTDYSDCNLQAMDTLADSFGYPVGFSDHTLGIEIAVAAAARRAMVIEKHLTLDRALSGPDHLASLTPAEFAGMVRSIRNVEKALGDGVKRPAPCELETKSVVRKVIVVDSFIGEGQCIREDDLVLQRASEGLEPSNMAHVIGRRVVRDLQPGETLSWDLLV
jgi:N-acetylneuraminate synthase/N,N'-diacetyllegionaminate synthase